MTLKSSKNLLVIKPKYEDIAKLVASTSCEDAFLPEEFTKINRFFPVGLSEPFFFSATLYQNKSCYILVFKGQEEDFFSKYSQLTHTYNTYKPLKVIISELDNILDFLSSYTGMSSLHFAGQFIGGWLAEVAIDLYDRKYATVFSSATTFDNPGASNFINNFFSKDFPTNPKTISIHPNVVSFVSFPHTMNVCNKHLGKVYQHPFYKNEMKDKNSVLARIYNIEFTELTEKFYGLFHHENKFKHYLVIKWPELLIENSKIFHPWLCLSKAYDAKNTQIKIDSSFFQLADTAGYYLVVPEETRPQSFGASITILFNRLERKFSKPVTDKEFINILQKKFPKKTQELINLEIDIWLSQYAKQTDDYSLTELTHQLLDEPSSPNTWGWLPEQKKYLLDRSDKIEEISSLFVQNRVVILRSQFAGSGKSTIAYQYAKSCPRNQIIRWFYMDNPNSIKSCFIEWAQELGIPISDNINDNRITSIISAIYEHSEVKTKEWLLIFDDITDLESIKPYLPRVTEKNRHKNQKVLITSREISSIPTDWNISWNFCEISSFSLEQSINYLQNTCKNLSIEINPEDILLQLLQNIPLYLELFVGQIKTKGFNLAREDILRASQEENWSIIGYVWSIIKEDIKSEFKHEEEILWLLRCISYLNPEGISRRLLLLLCDGDELKLEDTVAIFRKWRLMQYRTKYSDDWWVMHKSLHEIIRQDYEKSVSIMPNSDYSIENPSIITNPEHRTFRNAFRLAHIWLKSIPQANYNSSKKTQTILSEELLHGYTLLDNADRLWNNFHHSLHSDLYQLKAQLCLALGEGEIRTANYDKALTILTKELVQNIKDQKIKSDMLFRIGQAYFYTDEYSLAEETFEESLTIAKNLEQADETVAKLLHWQGYVYLRQSKYFKAKEMLEEALKKKRHLYKNFSDHHPSIADTIHGLGTTSYYLGKYNTALDLFNKALQIKNSLLECDELEIAGTNYWMGIVYNSLEKIDEAENLLKQSLFRRQSVNPNHPDVARTLSMLANICTSRAEKIREELELSGSRQQKKSHSFDKLIQNASNYYNEAITIMDRLYTRENQLIRAEIYYRRGKMYQVQDDYKKAEDDYQKSRSIMENIMDNNAHSRLAKVYCKLGDLRKSQDQYIEALENYEQAFKQINAVYGEFYDHPLLTKLTKRIQQLFESSYISLFFEDLLLKSSEQDLEKREIVAEFESVIPLLKKIISGVSEEKLGDRKIKNLDIFLFETLQRSTFFIQHPKKLSFQAQMNLLLYGWIKNEEIKSLNILNYLKETQNKIYNSIKIFEQPSVISDAEKEQLNELWWCYTLSVYWLISLQQLSKEEVYNHINPCLSKITSKQHRESILLLFMNSNYFSIFYSELNLAFSNKSWWKRYYLAITHTDLQKINTICSEKQLPIYNLFFNCLKEINSYNIITIQIEQCYINTVGLSEIFSKIDSSDYPAKEYARIWSFAKGFACDFLVRNSPTLLRSVCRLSQDNTPSSSLFFIIFEIKHEDEHKIISITLFEQSNASFKLFIKENKLDKIQDILRHYVYRLLSLDYQSLDYIHKFDHLGNYFRGYRGEKIRGLEKMEENKEIMHYSRFEFEEVFETAKKHYENEEYQKSYQFFSAIALESTYHRIDSQIYMQEIGSLLQGITLFWETQPMKSTEEKEDKLCSALACFENVLYTHSQQETALLFKANILFACGRELSAIFALDRLVKIRGKLFISAQMNRGVMLYEMGEYAEALKDFDAILSFSNIDNDDYQSIKIDAEEYREKIKTLILNSNEEESLSIASQPSFISVESLETEIPEKQEKIISENNNPDKSLHKDQLYTELPSIVAIEIPESPMAITELTRSSDSLIFETEIKTRPSYADVLKANLVETTEEIQATKEAIEIKDTPSSSDFLKKMIKPPKSPNTDLKLKKLSPSTEKNNLDLDWIILSSRSPSSKYPSKNFSGRSSSKFFKQKQPLNIHNFHFSEMIKEEKYPYAKKYYKEEIPLKYTTMLDSSPIDYYKTNYNKTKVENNNEFFNQFSKKNKIKQKMSPSSTNESNSVEKKLSEMSISLKKG